ncbi:efflux RND transporter permease subunit, partial [Serratia marcescens]|uniref:efflux RND transporter permease subunit n=2 Tax=Pseudomonadota TaxID=1224 RepID=UPI0013DCBD6B
AMRVWLDPQKVAELGLSPGDITREIQAQNVEAAAGTVGGSPNSTDITLQMPLNAQGRLKDEQEFGDIVIKTGQN